MAVAAETLVKIVPELESDQAVRLRAAEFIGAVATGNCVEAPTDVRPIESLYHAIQAAEAGNEEARALIETNVRTDVIERTIKAGHVMRVGLMVDESGRIRQHGQSMDSVQANSLRFAADSWQVRERTEAETRNTFRIQHHYNERNLEDYNFVVFSRAADNMSQPAMKQAGFFTDTMSCAIQVTSAENGVLATESAFVAGVERPGGDRHDAETIVEMAKEFDVDLEGMSAAEIIDTPLLIPKALMPNGAIDLVARYDSVRDTFYGKEEPKQDYLEHLAVCEEREERFRPKVEKIVEQLISEARTIRTPLMATERLHKISEEQMLQQAIGDDDIDPGVFGPKSAHHLKIARNAYRHGQADVVIQQVNIALRYADSSSCPGAGGNSTNNDNETNQNSSVGTCEFMSKECPKCHKKNVWTKVTETHISGSCGCSTTK